jgi:Trk K+ transport system NAD-binding subunit
MESIFFLIMRRMRTPLLALILAYAVSILGLVLIPGMDDQGNPWRMDFFHAFYFVSYMATTIGFGEIPYPFTDYQRMWVMVTIYLTVVVWIYSIGTLIALLQDRALRRVFVEGQFARQVESLREPFYLICGYGETGRALVATLIENGSHAVVVDADPDRLDQLKMEVIREQVPALLGESRNPENLEKAGLLNPMCRGVVALTPDNNVNLKIAISAKLLRREIKVICRADSKEVEANMASFGTDHIIDPFDTFALHLATAFQSPCLFLLRSWLTGKISVDEDPVCMPGQGKWILCGYGRFGKAVYHRLLDEELETVVIEATPEKTGHPPGGVMVTGWGTDETTLRTAGVEGAVGLVAGTDNDVNNLSIAMTAREINPDLFVVLRQNRQDNQVIVDAFGAEIVMHASAIVADKIRILLATPMLVDFFGLASYQDDQWSCTLFSRIAGLLEKYEPPLVWELEINDEKASAVTDAIRSGQAVKLGHLLSNPREREESLAVIALLLIRHTGDRVLLPEENLFLSPGDRLLLCGGNPARSRMRWTLRNEHSLRYIQLGRAPRSGRVWKFLRGG